FGHSPYGKGGARESGRRRRPEALDIPGSGQNDYGDDDGSGECWSHAVPLYLATPPWSSPAHDGCRPAPHQPAKRGRGADPAALPQIAADCRGLGAAGATIQPIVTHPPPPSAPG